MGGPHNFVLYRFEHDENEWCNSPFVNKLDALLTFSGADFVHAGGSIYKAPRGQFPYIVLNGSNWVPDSELAYNTCIEHKIVECLDVKANLTPKEQALSFAIKSLVERDLVEIEIHERWILNYYPSRESLLQDVPWYLRPLVGHFLVYRVIAQRMGGLLMKLTPQERQKNLENYVAALDALVPSSGYILGKGVPTRIDATVFGFLASAFRYPELSPKTTAELHQRKNLVEYVRRISAQYWPGRPSLV